MADDKELLDEVFQALSGDDEADGGDDALREVASRATEPGLQDAIYERYLSHGRDLLADSAPDDLDPRVISKLEPILCDVRHVRVHSGPLATAAAQAMDARAFAIGDKDVFVDRAELDTGSDRGVALLAHEVAHTKDPSVAYARSGRQPDVSGAEQRADDAAARVTKASRQQEADKVEADKSGSGETPNLNPEDKRRVEQMVWDILQRQQRVSSERRGR